MTVSRGQQLHQGRINEVLYKIHQDIRVAHTAKSLADVAAYSPFHFQRVFKEVTGENLNDYLRRTRLEQAANKLLFEPESSVADVAHSCGFLSHASFSQAFKRHFGASPKVWRSGGYAGFTQANFDTQQRDIAAAGAQVELPNMQLRQMPERRVAYVRHQGYDRSISIAWHRLLQWAKTEEVDTQTATMLALHHSNPSLVALADCRYVACLEVPENVWRKGSVGILTIPGGLHGVFSARGRMGDLLPLIYAFYHRWLPGSGYHLANTPAYAIYQRNQFLDPDERFELQYAVPLSVV
ncbi:GyrI-like domain-containing protein [Neptunomonas sp. XY-337]|uniref:AraC family transcriptional regulator n=1 Tax=Neptunomonas sp. XY-337 TaxID=2561897 RepID=UPI0010A9EA70|nr:GyrI-like domain-containing protein [Neptunomonas sp. XY-337]